MTISPERLEQLTPILLKKVRGATQAMARGNVGDLPDSQEIRGMAQTALWETSFEAPELADEELVAKSFTSLVRRMRDDWSEAVLTSKRHGKSPVENYFVTPWGSAMKSTQIKSGEGPSSAAVDVSIDFDLADNADALFELLDNILLEWGPHVWLWFVLTALEDGNAQRAMEKLWGQRPSKTLYQQVRRSLIKVREGLDGIKRV